MTDIEKAINYWKQFKKEIKKLREIKLGTEWEEQEKATDLAISALEKHIPRQPKWEQIYDTCISPDDYEFLCPTCEEVIEYEQQICFECYQVIDWRVEE